jgi:hypothetical protein
MNNRTYFLKPGEVGATLVAILKDAQDKPVSLTGYTAQIVITAQRSETRLIAAAMTPDPDQTANKGKVRYTFTTGDLTVIPAGIYEFEIAITDGLGNVIKFPKQAGSPFGIIHVLPSK